MVELNERDQSAIRRRILEEFEKVQAYITTHSYVWRSVTFRVHKRICETVGEDFVNYPEFEFWFSRFIQGNLDLAYDRSSDPKARSIIDLPLEVFKKIGEYLKLKDRIQLRDVCKDIRYQVENWDLKLDEISYSSADDWTVRQTLGQRQFRVCNYERKYYNIFSSGFNRNPMSFLMSVLKLPKLRLEKLTIHEQDDYWEKLIRKLDRSNRKLYVKKVQFPYFWPSKIDLRFMIPGVLEEITMYPIYPTREEMREYVESEQFQAAKVVYIDSWTETSEFPLETLYNCPRFTLKLGGRPADALKAMFLKKLMNKEKVQECGISAQREIMEYFNESEAMVPNFPTLRRFPIPGTNDFYELEYQGEAVHLERKQ